MKPPSVQGWVKNGRIDKSKLMDVIAYFADVVGPEHWGLRPCFTYESLQDVASVSVEEPAPTSAADMVRNMLAKQGKNLPESARAQLMAAAEASDRGNVITIDFSRPGPSGMRFELLTTMCARPWATAVPLMTILRC